MSNRNNPVKKHVRQTVFARDGFICQYCGRPHLTEDTGTVDHIHPQALGGKHTTDNLRTSCRPCNSRRGLKTIEEFRFLFAMASSGLGEIVSAPQAKALKARGIDLQLPAPFVFYFERKGTAVHEF